jgi:hypothetical protein
VSLLIAQDHYGFGGGSLPLRPILESSVDSPRNILQNHLDPDPARYHIIFSIVRVGSRSKSAVATPGDANRSPGTVGIFDHSCSSLVDCVRYGRTDQAANVDVKFGVIFLSMTMTASFNSSLGGMGARAVRVALGVYFGSADVIGRFG